MSTRISAAAFEFATLVDLLRWRADQQPEERIYTFLTDKDEHQEFFTFADLDRQARIVGAALQEHCKGKERALLIYPSGLEFIAAFFGCLYSGIIAVPVYPPSAVRSDRTLSKFRAIAHDAQPSVILTCASLFSRVEGLLAQTPELAGAHVLITDQLQKHNAAAWQAPAISNESLAFLQYTSGSTGIPKGVMVTHGNLLQNSAQVEYFCEHPLENAHGVTWLPLYHDLGLIGGILQPLFAGYASTIISPTAFLQRPIRWLQAISQTRATICGAPNFAYDLCVKKITAEQKQTLDLSSWEIVGNGAEPVRLETLERFAEAFKVCGFRRAYSYPCYGLAEATLVVAAGKKGIFPTTGIFQGPALEHNQVLAGLPGEKGNRTLVSIGRGHPAQQVLIVDPDTITQAADNQVGEIWVAGTSIAQGYWQRPEETKQVFQAHLSTGAGPFLRTGDLGFQRDGELFITGRLKDLIIIRGSNHYPQDIEVTVEKSHPALRTGGAAFSVERDGEERLVVVQEVERSYLTQNLDPTIAAIRQAIAEQHDLQVDAIVLIKTGSIPKTSSGKIQHRGCKEAYLNGTLEIIKAWHLPSEEAQTSAIPEEPIEPETAHAGTTSQQTATTIQTWLIAQIADALKLNARDVDVHAPFAHYGMDSVQAVSLSADLEDWLGHEVSPTLVYDYPSIAALAHFLGGTPLVTDLRAQEEVAYQITSDAIAIIGLGCRFPGANNPEEFWRLLRDGVDGISEVPEKRWDAQSFYAPEQATPGKMNTRWGGFLQNIDQFDPAFFGISPREAAGMDPQQRLLLEVAWETLEYAGKAPTSIAGSQTGVFIGISSDDYSRLQFKDAKSLDAYAGTGNAHSIAANRLSYFLDLRGPSIALDTACSSSLVAVHQACQSLRNGECEQALAGGVNLILTPELTITFSQARMMSSIGRCQTFDEEADGYVRGEGCGLVLLKPLAQAISDKDSILAVIRGSAVNQDGRSNGLTAPNGPAQEAVIRQALHNAGAEPAQITYVETHGSSTPLGDPIEVDALKAVLLQNRAPEQTCYLGSVKTNIGHLEAAAGIAGLIKTVLCLQKGEIAPHLHLKKLNPHISLAGTAFAIPTSRQPWPTSERRFAGVSAFGFGGTNAHIILEEATIHKALNNSVDRPQHLLTLSAQTTTALQTQARQYVKWLSSQPHETLADICFTANTGRTHFAQRLAVSAGSTAQLQERLAAFASGRTAPGVQQGQTRQRVEHKIAFLFTGQGAQYVGMAQQLYATQPTFRQALERCDRILRDYLEQPLLAAIFPLPAASSPLHETAYTQPALFAIEYALAEMWRSWGIEPAVVMGHSVGEYVAACVAGMFSLEDGLKLITTRGKLMQALSQDGAMVVVFAEAARLQATLALYPEQVSIAAINGPKNTVLSGARQAIQEIVQYLEADGLTTHAMQVSHAFHSPLMEPMLADFAQVAQQIQFTGLRIPFVANLTGQLLAAGTTLDADYWRRQTRETVQFEISMHTIAEHGYDLCIEIGPDTTLSNMGKRCLPDASMSWLSSLRKKQDDWQVLLESVAKLYISGTAVDWIGFDQDYPRQKRALPTYPFERAYCWFEIGETQQLSRPEQAAPAVVDTQRHPLLDAHVALVAPAHVHVWEIALNTQRIPYLNDHRIQGVMALPISVYIEMAQAATVEAFGAKKQILTNIELKKLLLLPEKGSQKVQVILSASADEQVVFQIYSHTAGMPDQPHHLWTLHATGNIRTT